MRATFACAQRFERGDTIGRDHEHVALLRLVTPELHRRHAGLVGEHRAQIDDRTTPAVRHGLGHGVRQSTRTDVVNQQNRILLALRPTAIDHFLCAALHLGVTALHRGEIEIRRRITGTDRRCRATTETNQHRWAAEHHEFRARWTIVFLDVRAAHVAESTGDHDRLVIAARATGHGVRRHEL